MMKPGRMKVLVVLLVLSLLAISISGCGQVNHLIDRLITETTETTDEDAADRDKGSSTTTRSKYFVDILPGEDPPLESQSDDVQELVLDEQFDLRVQTCLMQGVDAYSLEIDMSDCLDMYVVYEDQVDMLVQRLVDVYEHIYMQDPMMFYFNGAMKVGYELQSGWSQRQVANLTVSLQRHNVYENATPQELEATSARIQEEADRIAQLAGADRSDWEKMLVIHDELVRRIVYDTDLDQEKNQVASALLDGLTLCKGYAQAFQLVCDRLGLDCQIISGRSGGIEHAWNLVKLDGKHYHVDVTHDDPVPDRGPNAPVDHRHFLRSDAAMRETHQWDADVYPACPDDGVHYFRQNDLYVHDRNALNQKIQQFLVVNDFSDNRDDHLELLYLGEDLPDSGQLDQIFKQVVENSNLRISFSYHLSSGKNVLQIIVLAG